MEPALLSGSSNNGGKASRTENGFIYLLVGHVLNQHPGLITMTHIYVLMKTIYHPCMFRD